MLNNRVYQILKYVALVVLPALAAFIGTVGLAFNWQYTDITITLVTAFDTFLGALLGVSTSQYNKKGNNQE